MYTPLGRLPSDTCDLFLTLIISCPVEEWRATDFKVLPSWARSVRVVLSNTTRKSAAPVLSMPVEKKVLSRMLRISSAESRPLKKYS